MMRWAASVPAPLRQAGRSVGGDVAQAKFSRLLELRAKDPSPFKYGRRAAARSLVGKRDPTDQSTLRRYTGPTAQVQGDCSAARTSRAPLPFGDGPAELSGVILIRVTDGVDSDHTVNGLRSPPQPQSLTRSTADHCFDDGTSCRPSTTAPCIGGIVTPAAASCRHTSKFRSLLNVPAVFRCSVLHTWS